MPRYPTAEKTINGQKVTQEVFLNTICEAVAEVEGGAGVGDIISALGPEYDNSAGRKLVGQSMINLFNRGILLRGAEKGIYTVNTVRYKRTGVTRFDQDEKAILRILRRRGGFAHYHEIMEDLGIRPTGDAENRMMIMSMPEYRRVTGLLAKSEKIRQDITDQKNGIGVYNLPWEEVMTLPLIGYWAGRYIKHTYAEIIHAGNHMVPEDERQKFGEHEWQRERDSHYETVGAAFRRLRRIRRMEIDDLIDHKKVRVAIAEFWRSCDKRGGPIPVIRQEWLDHRDIEIDKIRKAAEEEDGRPLTVRRQEAQARIEAYKIEQEKVWELQRYRWLYRHFENGRVGAHAYAPLLLYTSIAEFFEVCPAALSRGSILLKPDSVKYRPENYRRTMDEIIEAELRNEADLEATRRLLEEIAEERAAEGKT